MVHSFRRWAQASVVVLAAVLATTVVVLGALQHQPQDSPSSAAAHYARQLLDLGTTVPPMTFAPMATVPTLPPLTGVPAMALMGVTTSPAPTVETDETEKDVNETKVFFAVLVQQGAALLIFLTLAAIQVCCYMRSTHEPADIEEALGAGSQVVNEDLWGPRLLLIQVIKIIECFGCEAKNKYVSGDGNFYIDERSDCPQRCCASVNRELTLFGHAGPSEEAPVVLRMFKPYHLQGCCCCCRPELHIDMPMGDDMVPVGRIEDPCRCCAANQMVFDSNNELRYEVTGSICQCGAFCACCADFHFDVNDKNGQTVGAITKKTLSCKECCFKTNRFEIAFPNQCTLEEKRLLVGSAMLLDLQYFETNKNDNN